ncbi:MAG TPA: hypothetical protein VEJ89_09285 [Myxococcaceae bacterium]|nr:hypothetical protein [Myxococcaceae bacterium]
MRLTTLHQVVIGGAAVGAGLVCLYAALQARSGRGATWGVLAAAAASTAVGLILYLRRFRRTHRGPPPG